MRVGEAGGEAWEKVLDPFWGTGSRSFGRCALRGFMGALKVLKANPQMPEETIAAYAERLCGLLDEAQAEFRADPDDEDGASAGAVGDAIDIVRDLAKGRS